jgi:hypothetical protein
VGAAGLQKAQVALRDAGREGGLQLRLAGAAAIDTEGFGEGWADGGSVSFS